MESKYLIFFFSLLFGVTIASGILIQSRFLQKVGFFLAVFTIPYVYLTGINFFDDPSYRGTARGYEILSTDLVVITMGLVLILRYGTVKFIIFPCGAFFYIVYFAISFLSIINADSWNYWGYEIVKMVRVYLYFVVLYNCIIQYRDFRPIMIALFCILLCTAYMMLVQKYIWGIYQPSGIFPHRNSAAMFANMSMPIFFSAILNSKSTKFESLIYWGGFVLGCMVVVISLSRGAIVMMPLAMSIVVLISFRHRLKWSFKKIRIVLLIAFLGLIGVAKTLPSIIERFDTAPESSKETRVVLARSAVNMADKEFFGVGLNNWGIKINPPYTYWENTGMVRSENFKAGIVETIYLLVAAECGWWGLIALVMWLIFYLIEDFFNILRYSGCRAEYMAIGIFAALCVLYLQSSLEWGLKQSTNFYGLALMFAIVAAMSDSYYRAYGANGIFGRIKLWTRRKSIKKK